MFYILQPENYLFWYKRENENCLLWAESLFLWDLVERKIVNNLPSNY
jgi:hypothetical protein